MLMGLLFEIDWERGKVYMYNDQNSKILMIVSWMPLVVECASSFTSADDTLRGSLRLCRIMQSSAPCSVYTNSPECSIVLCVYKCKQSPSRCLVSSAPRK